MINKQINQMNETLSRLKQFLKRPFFTDPRTLLWLWLLLALGSALIKFHKCNNFLDDVMLDKILEIVDEELIIRGEI